MKKAKHKPVVRITIKNAMRIPYNVPFGLSNKSIIKERAAMFETFEPAIMQQSNKDFEYDALVWRDRLQRVWFFTRFGHKGVSILEILIMNRAWVLYRSFELGTLFRTTSSSLLLRQSTKGLYTLWLGQLCQPVIREYWIFGQVLKRLETADFRHWG